MAQRTSVLRRPPKTEKLKQTTFGDVAEDVFMIEGRAEQLPEYLSASSHSQRETYRSEVEVGLGRVSKILLANEAQGVSCESF